MANIIFSLACQQAGGPDLWIRRCLRELRDKGYDTEKAMESVASYLAKNLTPEELGFLMVEGALEIARLNRELRETKER